jgi:hypothetical protein
VLVFLLMERRQIEWALLVLFLFLWLMSFFLPADYAEHFPNAGASAEAGWEAAFSSIVIFWVPIYGQLWIGNVFMILSPGRLRRRGTGKIFLRFFWFFALIPLIYPYFPLAGLDRVKKMGAGYYVWECSMIGMCVLLTSTLRQATAPHALELAEDKKV